jgi:hypothetical protein
VRRVWLNVEHFSGCTDDSQKMDLGDTQTRAKSLDSDDDDGDKQDRGYFYLAGQGCQVPLKLSKRKIHECSFELIPKDSYLRQILAADDVDGQDIEHPLQCSAIKHVGLTIALSDYPLHCTLLEAFHAWHAADYLNLPTVRAALALWFGNQVRAMSSEYAETYWVEDLENPPEATDRVEYLDKLTTRVERMYQRLVLAYDMKVTKPQ